MKKEYHGHVLHKSSGYVIGHAVRGEITDKGIIVRNYWGEPPFLITSEQLDKLGVFDVNMTNEEIDEKIAEKIGGTLSFFAGRDAWKFTIDNEDLFVESNEWSPSTDWRDAMFAAENHKKFTTEYVVYPQRFDWGITWIVSKVNSANELGEKISSERSGPLAICKAILSED